jgi:DNA polymerase-1
MKAIKEKKQPFPIYPIEAWSVEKYGIKLNINIPMGLTRPGISLDVEDDGRGDFVGLGIFDGQEAYYWSDFELAKQLNIGPFIAHNGVSDIYKLKQWGFDVSEDNLLWDTQLMAHYQDSTRKKYGLKDLAKADLGIEYPSYKDLIKRGKEWINLKILQGENVELVANYNAMDCYATYKLAVKQGFKGEAAPKYFTSFERPISFIFHNMSANGISVDLGYLTKLKETLEAQREPIKQQILNELGPINLNSPKQLLGALNGKAIFPMLKNKSSTDKRALVALASQPIIQKLLQFSEIDTLLSSFVAPYLERNETVVHPQFHQTGTRTGRPSCSNPNLLQIPKRSENGKLVRKMFVSRPGYVFGRCDYKEGETPNAGSSLPR